jgi:RimJ/RimL family protein N-acetyltransferase
MKIKALSKTPINSIVHCLQQSFADYFVQMPADPSYWENRWKGARVDYGASFGTFQTKELVGFMIHGLDFYRGIFTAFNTGTGIIPTFRGQRIVQKMYEKAIPELQERGVQSCRLEVIQKNEKAIKAYQRAGFSVQRELKCYRGRISAQNEHTVQLKKMDLHFFDWDAYEGQDFYSWDHVRKAILLQENQYELYEVAQDQEGIGYFIINPHTGYLAQFDLNDRRLPMHWTLLFEGIAQVSSKLKILNIDVQEHAKIQIMEYLGLDNYIDQYEMELTLG